MSCFKNALIFGDQNFSSGDHFTKESRQKATSEKLELEALLYIQCFLFLKTVYTANFKIQSEINQN